MNNREEEIVDALAEVYKKKSFNEITIKDIAEKTSFTRPSIYNYFKTKEEIFLLLSVRELSKLKGDIVQIERKFDSLSEDEFATLLAGCLSRRTVLLKLMAMNHYEIEENSRVEKLVLYKKEYKLALDALRSCLSFFFPSMGEKDREDFILSFFSLLFGIYPYTHVTEKMQKAMDEAGLVYKEKSVEEFCSTIIRRLLNNERR